jgi:hypothetical protein
MQPYTNRDHFLHTSRHEQQTDISASRVGHGNVSAVDGPIDVIHIRNKQQVPAVSGKSSPASDSWDTDFSDDEVSKVSNINRSLY